MGMTKFFVDEDGQYLGGFDGAEPPEGSIEVPEAPERASQIWKNGEWGPVYEPLKKLSRFQFELVLEFLNITQQQVFEQIDLLDMPAIDKIVAKKKVETGGNDGLWSRENPLWGILGPKLGVSPEKIDEEWRKVQVL